LSGDRWAEIRGSCNEGNERWTGEDWERAAKDLMNECAGAYSGGKPTESEMVQFLGVYALCWQESWGEPTMAFVELDG